MWQVYAELTPKPIAAASLGQVYKGRLKSGEQVAVKVQRPYVVETVSIDLFIIRYKVLLGVISSFTMQHGHRWLRQALCNRYNCGVLMSFRDSNTSPTEMCIVRRVLSAARAQIALTEGVAAGQWESS